MSAILLDVDYFKRDNDCYGHPEGDKCLFHVAQAAQQVLERLTHLVARYGGEEFSVVLLNANQEKAILVTERICAAIQALSISHRDSEVSDIVLLAWGFLLRSLVQKHSQKCYKALYNAKH